MTTIVNKKTLEQYRQIFGTEKMKSLWDEFQDTTEDKFEKATNGTLEDIRLSFHSLRSAALVFGLEKFAENCEQIENNIIAGATVPEIKKAVDKSKEFYYNARGKVIKIFEDL